MNSMKRSRVLHGFTLIEMAIVVVIVGIVVSTIATVLPSLIQSAKIKKARAILEKVDYALEGYITANGQCPCPDTDGDGLENRNPGTTPPTDDTCNAYVGDLPYRTLGLSSGEDNWRNPIKYGVYEDFIRTTSSSGSNFFCNRLRDTINYFRTNNPDTSKLYSSDSVGDTNQLYIIVTGGSKDFDGIDGFFDGLNSGTDVQFEAPNKIVDATYDDLVQVVSFNYLRGKDCTGGPGGGGGVENGYPNGCTNGEDDDGDGMEDCNDPDCFGDPACLAGGENVTIATESVPPGSVNSDYSSVTFTASGGITPYEWELLGDGGFTDFYLHPYTGHLSGTLSQCPGSYEIQVQVTDSTQPTPTTNTKSFNIQVSANLDVTRTSGDQSTTIIWDSPTQQETFKTNGGHIGDIDWSLNAGGASGFTVISTGTDTCAIKKDGITTPSPPDYTFTLTATDPDCPTNTASIILTVTVTASGVSAPHTANLSAEWHLDECNWNGTSGEVLDSGSDGIDGTAQNGADTIGSGKVCRAGFFDGIDDYVDMEDSLNDVLGTSSNSFTAVAWIYPLSLGVAQTNHNTQNCFLAKASDPINDNLEIGINTNGTVHVYIDTTGRDTYTDFGIGEITINKWSFVAVSYNNGTVSVTINGTKYENT
ncbi:MAG: LamG-like jellyroll fold domain-containing protein, partial [Thermodesulfobacteriota bacterium]|nr:LamG-like jellyroll fold domain-containing protein [Thermodesulfobacteriota bacterium]